jgi:hypothetical protein
MSFTSSNDKVIQYDVSFGGPPKKKGLRIESSSEEPFSEEQFIEQNIEPIYGDGLDGVKWNVPEYDRLWSNLPSKLRTGLITDREWMQEFMSSCVAARASGQACIFISPKNLMLPPDIGPDGKVNFGINVYNQAYESLPENLKKTYLTFYKEVNGERDYTMLANAMNDLVAKMVQFNQGYF